MFNRLPGAMLARGISTNEERALTAAVLSCSIPRLSTSSHRLFNPAQPEAVLACDLVVAGQKLQPPEQQKENSRGRAFFLRAPDQAGDAKSPGRGERKIFFRPARAPTHSDPPGIRLPAHPRLFSDRRSAAHNLQSQIIQSGATGGVLACHL